MQRFTDLRVWQRSHAAALQVYRITKGFPEEERFGLLSQLRRASVSVAANIAEGAKREASLEYSRFLNISESSASEAQALLLLARDLGLVSEEPGNALFGEYDEISKMLSALRSKLARPTAQRRSKTVTAGN